MGAPMIYRGSLRTVAAEPDCNLELGVEKIRPRGHVSLGNLEYRTAVYTAIGRG